MKIRKPRPSTPVEVNNSYIGRPPVPNAPLAATNISTKGDRTSQLSITIKDIDEAIVNYINNRLKPTISQNGKKVVVPLLWISPERWASVQKYGYIREQSRRILTPIIVVTRASVGQNVSLTQKLDGNAVKNYYTVPLGYSQKNQYDNFAVQTDRNKVRKFMRVVVPDYVNLKYNFTMFTNYIESSNELIEQFQYVNRSYWGEDGKYKFKVNIANFSVDPSFSEGADRIIKTSFDIDSTAYIISENQARFLSYQPEVLSTAKINITTVIAGNSPNQW